MNVSMHMNTYVHTHTHTHMCLTLIFIAIQGVWHLHVHGVSGLQIQVVVGGVYIIIGDQTLPKGGVSPRKVPPIPHIILDQQAIWIGQCSHSVQSSNIGSSLGCGHGL